MFETTKRAELVAEAVIQTLFDPSWSVNKREDPFGSFDCGKVPLMSKFRLEECPADVSEGNKHAYSCYPKLHDGRTIHQWLEHHEYYPDDLGLLERAGLIGSRID